MPGGKDGGGEGLVLRGLVLATHVGDKARVSGSWPSPGSGRLVRSERADARFFCLSNKSLNRESSTLPYLP